MIKSLTYTATKTYLECAYRFQLIYLEQRPAPVALSLFLGSTLHLALATFYQRGIEGNPMTCRECESFFTEALRKQTVLQHMPSAQGVAWEDRDPRSLEAETLPLLRLYLNWAEKTGLSPACVEREVRRTVGGLPIYGRIDLIDRSGIVIDWKTTQAYAEQAEAGNVLQPLFYAALLGRPIEFHFHYLHKLPALEIRWETRSVSRSAIQWLTQEFLPPVWEAMRCGVYPYADPSSRTCSPSCCDHWGTCKGGALRSDAGAGKPPASDPV